MEQEREPQEPLEARRGPAELGTGARAGMMVVVATIVVASYLAFHRLSARADGRGASDVAIAGATLRTEAGDRAVASFHIDETEVTVRAYRACEDAHACTPAGRDPGCNAATPRSDGHPIQCVDHAQAESYCRWAGRRLPSEDEWELAARGKDGREYPWGSTPPDPSRANFADLSLVEWRADEHRPAPPTLLSVSDGWPNSAAVGTFEFGRTPDGVADLAGNVREWTASPACAHRGETCASKSWIVRGGGFLTATVEETRAAHRQVVDGASRAEDLGFRCAR